MSPTLLFNSIKNIHVKALIAFVLFYCFFYSECNAYTDPYLCSKYYKLRIRNVEKVLAVGISKVNNTSVETYVLGFGTPIHATINGAKLTDAYISKEEPCSVVEKLLDTSEYMN